jgi:copper homeostasis protein
MVLEACVNSALSAVEAFKGGAHRVELCENLHDGGTTPSVGAIRYAREHIDIGLYVMIRPRGGDFLYSEAEFSIMKEDIRLARYLDADGVVFGMLNANGTVDRARTGELVRLARPMGVTFHRAFDMTADPFVAMEDLVSLGVDRILTSGQSDSALEGADLIRQLVDRSAGRIIIMPGHGIKEHNLAEAIAKTGASEFHLYLPKQVKSEMKFIREDVKMGKPDLSEYETTLIDAERIRTAAAILTHPTK